MTDALVSEQLASLSAHIDMVQQKYGMENPDDGPVRDLLDGFHLIVGAHDAIDLLTRESQAEGYLDVLINSPDPHWIDVSKRRDERAQRAADVIRNLRQRAETAETALSAARAELATTKALVEKMMSIGDEMGSIYNPLVDGKRVWKFDMVLSERNAIMWHAWHQAAMHWNSGGVLGQTYEQAIAPHASKLNRRVS